VATPSSQQACPLTAALDVLGGKWHLIVLYALAQRPRRFNELQRLAPGVSHKVLTQTVRHLESHGLVVRTVGTDAAPCVQYALSYQGETTRPILAAMVEWGQARLSAGIGLQAESLEADNRPIGR
jgi:DNA-binding HxlR family transcriptional regulator